jgi:N-acetylglucosaminyldiphosphoundecaprenol N-acetyl-beta-D-mannosaminyltransferase
MDDFERDVYCIGGLPFDAINISKTMSRLREAKFKKTSCFLTTPNLNFLALSQDDPDFRNSVIYSDIVIADGTPIVWISKLLGIPVRERVAGSTLFETLGQEWRRKMNVYFFGGPGGVAAEACKRINDKSTGLNCVGYHSPGFGTVDEMSESSIIDDINLSSADFLVVALGAKKGQAWILKNLDRIKVPLISHLGAVINFEAKRLKRAPARLQKIGLEWAWRIKEEPHLWRRYWADGQFLIRLLFTKILPHSIWLRFKLTSLKNQSYKSRVVLENSEFSTRLIISGVVLDPISSEIRSLMRQASININNVQIDFAEAEYISSGFFGLLLLLKKNLDKQGRSMELIGIGSNIKKLLYWNGLSYLME